ncbi:MAG: SDR family oxidoreductase, partial [Bacteroidota bacterium]
MPLTLVTGATGLLGSELVRQLVEANEPVAILRRPTSKLDLLGPAADAVEHRIGDVTDVDSVHDAMQDVTRVYHLAAYIGFGGASDAEKLHRVNVGGTANVVNAAREAGVRRLVHTSSIAALGRTGTEDDPIDESAIWQPSPENTLYAKSKYEAELEIHRGIAEGLDAVMVNPSLIFGPGRPEENTMQIALKVKNGRLPAYPTGGTCVVDSADVASGHRRAMLHGQTGERYVLGGENLRWKAIFEALAKAFGVKPPQRPMPPRIAYAGAIVMEAAAKLFRRPALVTRETVRTANRFYRYSN